MIGMYLLLIALFVSKKAKANYFPNRSSKLHFGLYYFWNLKSVMSNVGQNQNASYWTHVVSGLFWSTPCCLFWSRWKIDTTTQTSVKKVVCIYFWKRWFGFEEYFLWVWNEIMHCFNIFKKVFIEKKNEEKVSASLVKERL